MLISGHYHLLGINDVRRSFW